MKNKLLSFFILLYFVSIKSFEKTEMIFKLSLKGQSFKDHIDDFHLYQHLLSKELIQMTKEFYDKEIMCLNDTDLPKKDREFLKNYAKQKFSEYGIKY